MARLFSFLLAFVLVTAGLSAQNSVAGSWELTINAPEGPMNATAELKQDGDKVTGSISSQIGKTELSGTFSGKTLSLSFQVQTQQGAMDIKVNGEVDGNDMKGVIDFGMGMADFTAKKK